MIGTQSADFSLPTDASAEPLYVFASPPFANVDNSCFSALSRRCAPALAIAANKKLPTRRIAAEERDSILLERRRGGSVERKT